MSSLVEELQRDALNQSVTMVELLQKALVVATKLNFEDFASWARRELDGYGSDEVPAYRIIRGSPQVFNPYSGYQPLHFGDAKFAELCSKMHFNTPIGELEHDVLRTTKAGSVFQVSYSQKTETMLMNAIEFGLKPSLRINESRFQGIFNAVRKIILEWSLKLEADGISGQGMVFSDREKERAHANTYNIKSYIHGDIQNSQLQIDAVHSSQEKTAEFDLAQLAKLIEALRSVTGALGIDDKSSRELESEIATLESQAQSPNPKHNIIG